MTRSTREAELTDVQGELSNLADQVGLDELCEIAAKFITSFGKAAVPAGKELVDNHELEEMRFAASLEGRNKAFADRLLTRGGAVFDLLKKFGLGDEPSSILRGLVSKFGMLTNLGTLDEEIKETRDRPGDEEHRKALQALKVKLLEQHMLKSG
jgi:hypothetical protein